MSDPLNPLPDKLAVGWRDRLLGWRAVAATTLASVILGSAGGVALAAAADDNGTGRDGFGGRGQFPGNGQMPGQMGGQMGGQLPGQMGQVPAGNPGQIAPGAGLGQQSATLPRTDEKEA